MSLTDPAVDYASHLGDACLHLTPRVYVLDISGGVFAQSAPGILTGVAVLGLY